MSEIKIDFTKEDVDAISRVISGSHMTIEDWIYAQVAQTLERIGAYKEE